MEEPEQEREDGRGRPPGGGAGEAAPQRLACRLPSPRGPRRRRQGRFTGLRGLPLLPRPPALTRPPPPAAAAATAVPYPPRPPRLSLRASGDQRPRRTRLPAANRRRGRDTSHTAELEGAASPTSGGPHTPTSPRAGHAPSNVSGPPTSSPAQSVAHVQEVLEEEPGDVLPSSSQWPAPSPRMRRLRARPLGSCSLPSGTLLSLFPVPPNRITELMETEYGFASHRRTDQLWNCYTQFSSLGKVRGMALERRWEKNLY